MGLPSSWRRLRGLLPGSKRRSLPFPLPSRYVVKDASGAIVEARPDPPLIVAAGAITLALAIFANIAILFRLIDTHPVSVPPPKKSRYLSCPRASDIRTEQRVDRRRNLESEVTLKTTSRGDLPS